MITSGAEFPASQLKDIFAAGTSIKVCIKLFSIVIAGMHQVWFILWRELSVM